MNLLPNLRIADLELFITAGRMQSLGKAAKNHHLSQSAASSAIQRVEKACNLQLSTHEKRKFQLTEEGKAFLLSAEEWLEKLRLLLTQKKPPLRLATTHALSFHLIQPILSTESIDLLLMRPDKAYRALLHNEVDVAIVLDNAPWKGVIATEIGTGHFQLYCRKKNMPLSSVLLPEEQLEVLTFLQQWTLMYKEELPIKAHLPSWSLIADICSQSDEIGFLPSFLAEQKKLTPLSSQPQGSAYRILALYKPHIQERMKPLIYIWQR